MNFKAETLPESDSESLFFLVFDIALFCLRKRKTRGVSALSLKFIL